MRRLARVLGSVLLVVVLLLLVTREALDAPRPVAGPGPDGDALARRMEAAVNGEAWQKTGAVTWVFAGAHRHLWDRERGLDSVTMGEDRVLVDLGKQVGRAFHGEEPVEGRRGEKLVARAYAAWVNDSFWLNPVVKAFDEGVSRAVVVPTGEDAGKAGLLVSYSSGGLTPGDAYLWLLDPDGTPSAWRMWVSVIPVGGVRASWEGWTTLATGARVSTRHQMGPATLELTEVAGASTLAELAPGPDPFAPLFQ
jgi:hypothetical protein